MARSGRESDGSGGSEVNKVEVLLAATTAVVPTATAVVEMEEIQALLVDGQEHGFLTSDAIAAALEEAEAGTEQARDLLSYLEEHAIEVLTPGDVAKGGTGVAGAIEEPVEDEHPTILHEAPEPAAFAPEEEDGDSDARLQSDVHELDSQVHELRPGSEQGPTELDLSVEPGLDSLRLSLPSLGGGLASLRLYLRSIGRVPLLSGAEEVALAKRIERGDTLAKQHMVEANLRL